MELLVSKFRHLEFQLRLSWGAPYYCSLPRTVWYEATESVTLFKWIRRKRAEFSTEKPTSAKDEEEEEKDWRCFLEDLKGDDTAWRIVIPLLSLTFCFVLSNFYASSL